ncbi:alpha/beta fold hydrolase [Pedomonas mirosovicensis]|uniref:alpha/beta fold hydrolase n=1 Tax=Pedomonas mirosovicensis TaxID=2908641 RepID=UPI002169986F|nr:alpha/beta hydrolase [Pedomonas mirosovicensis]MCH8683750.1 alpha/beta hydrolase [Pedomonas mirosovicensis]
MSLFINERAGNPGEAEHPLVLVHGWCCDHGAMKPVTDAFPERHVISVDLLGHGRSPASNSYSIETQAAALMQAVPDGAILVGHSMGAQVAVEAAVQAPERVAGLVLLDPAPIVPHDSAKAYTEDMRRHIDRMDPEQLSDMLEVFGRRQIVKAADQTAVESLIEVMTRTPAAVVRACWDAVCNWDGPAAFARLTCPALAIVIERPLNRPVNLAKAYPKVMTGQVTGAGHMLQFEVMDQVEPMMRRFFALHRL